MKGGGEEVLKNSVGKLSIGEKERLLGGKEGFEIVKKTSIERKRSLSEGGTGMKRRGWDSLTIASWVQVTT